MRTELWCSRRPSLRFSMPPAWATAASRATRREAGSIWVLIRRPERRILEGGGHPMKPSALPDGVPVLSRGRHRTPRRGACFMEFASFLAGERWSDHPACTHPLLGHLARLVNDATTDAGRQQLAPLIPSVVGRR